MIVSLIKGPKNAKSATKGNIASLALFALVAFSGPLTKEGERSVRRLLQVPPSVCAA